MIFGRRAYRRGYRDGYAAGVAAMEAKVRPVNETLDRVIEKGQRAIAEARRMGNHRIEPSDGIGGPFGV